MSDKCIVLVDDEKDVCNSIGDFLKERGYVVAIAYDGFDGIALIREKKPDLVLLDIRMPKKDGIEVLTELREHDKDTKVVIVTGIEEGIEIDTARELGITGILRKPVRIGKLVSIIEENL